MPARRRLVALLPWLLCAVSVTVLGVATVLRVVGGSPGDQGYDPYLCLAGLLVFVFVLFPTGQPPSRGWRWLPGATVLLGVLLATATPFAPTVLASGIPGPWAPGGVLGGLVEDLVLAGVVGLLALVVTATLSVIPRFRRAGPVERQQLTWFVLAAAVNAAYLLVDLWIGHSGGVGIRVAADVVTPALIPLAVAIAVLRHRLYEIDRIISRSVSYGSLTGGLVVLYLVVVGVLRPLLEPLTGGSSVAVAGSMLAMAAAFTPARPRLQAVVDPQVRPRPVRRRTSGGRLRRAAARPGGPGRGHRWPARHGRHHRRPYAGRCRLRLPSRTGGT